jgi:Holliday junction resolvase RusA-like endonuclease
MNLQLPSDFKTCPVCQSRAYRGTDPTCPSRACRDQIAKLQQRQSSAEAAKPPTTSGKVVRRGRADRMPVPSTAVKGSIGHGPGRSPMPSARSRVVPSATVAADVSAITGASIDVESQHPDHGKVVAFTVEGRPYVKARPRVAHFEDADWDGTTTKKSRAYTPKTTLQYEKRVAEIAAIFARHRFAGHVRATVTFYTSVETADVDNWMKALLDACNGIVYDDDSQVRSHRVDHWTDYLGEERVELQFESFDTRHPEVR